MRKESIRPYRLRLRGTDWYFRPDIGSGNLSKKGKVYTTARNGAQSSTGAVLIDVRENSPAHRALLNCGYTLKSSYGKSGFVLAKVNKYDLIPEEV